MDDFMENFIIAIGITITTIVSHIVIVGSAGPATWIVLGIVAVILFIIFVLFKPIV